MTETVHVAVWVLVVGAALIGCLIALAYKNHVTPKVEAETLVGEAEAKVKAFDASVYSTIKQLEAESKVDAGSAVKYVESTVGMVLKKL